MREMIKTVLINDIMDLSDNPRDQIMVKTLTYKEPEELGIMLANILKKDPDNIMRHINNRIVRCYQDFGREPEFLIVDKHTYRELERHHWMFSDTINRDMKNPQVMKFHNLTVCMLMSDETMIEVK